MKVFLLAFALILSLSAQAQVSCGDIFYGEARALLLSENSLKFMDLVDSTSTTALRQEDKYVVSQNRIQGLLENLAKSYGRQFQLRDEKLPGQKNVTVTQYSDPIRIEVPGKKALSAKLRFRKYFSADAQTPLAKAELYPSNATKDRQFVELKIDHPLYPKVVIKPRMLVLDSDVSLIQKRDQFLRFENESRGRIQSLNPKLSPETIEQFFTVFKLMPSEIPMFAKTAYVRDSYVLNIENPAGKPIEVQITVDQEVQVKDSKTGKSISAYTPQEAVAEVKVPLSRAALSPQDLAEVPGLAAVVELKQALTEGHIDRFAPGAGKLSTFRRLRDFAD
jgi:hypothetical protein